jgi:hypothetical protein
VKKAKTKREIEETVFLSCVPGLKAWPLLCSLIRFCVSRVWFLLETPSLPALARCYPRGFTFYVARPTLSIHPYHFSLSQIFHLLRTRFAAVIRPLFNQFFGGHSVKGNNCPITLSIYDWTVPDIRRD